MLCFQVHGMVNVANLLYRTKRISASHPEARKHGIPLTGIEVGVEVV